MRLSTLFVVLFLSAASYGQQYSKVKIYTDYDGLKQLSQLGVPVDHGVHKQGVYYISDFSEDEIARIDMSGLPYEVLVDDVKAYYAAQNNVVHRNKNATCANGGGAAAQPTVPAGFETSASSYAGYYTYQQMLNALDAMQSQFPNLITVKTQISNILTWEGRPVYYVKISDNPTTNEASEPKVLYTAIHHAREPMSMSQTIFYMWYLLENYSTSEEIQFLVDNTEMYFVPCMNPDGYVENESTDPSGFGMHRKNMRPVGTSNPGVDNNRNYSYGWNTTGVSSNTNDDTYPGTSAFSEPENQAIKWLVENVGFTSAFNAHTYGQDLLHPIGTTVAEYADHHAYFEDLTQHMTSRNGYTYMKSSGLYPASGDSDDYMYKVDIGVGMKDTIFAMTPEIGTSFWPSQSEVIPTCQEMVFPNMVLSHMTHRYMVVNETDPGMISTMTGNFNHDVQRLGLENGTVTVSIEPLLNIQSVGSPVAYNLVVRETSSGTISYSLNPGIQFGEQIKYVLKTEYPLWTHRDTIVKTYGSLPVQIYDDASTSADWTGNWITTNSDFVSPSTSFTDGNGDYNNNANKTWKFNQTIDLTNATAAMISYYAKWEIETGYDYCQFQVSTNGGSSWIGQCGNYTTTGTNSGGWGSGVQPDGEPVYQGTQSSWVPEEIDLSDYLGQTIQVRFQLESDGGLQMDGFYFDDFTVSYAEQGSNGLEENTVEVKAFPNPAKDEVTISTSNVIKKGSVKMYNQAGQLVLEQNVNEQSNNIVINTTALKQGIYTVRVENDGQLTKPIKLSIIK